MIFKIILAENLFHCLFLKKKLFWSSNSVQVDELKRTTLKKNRQTTKAQKQTRNNIVKLFCFKSSLHFQSFWTTFLKLSEKKGPALNVKSKFIIDVFILVAFSSLGRSNFWKKKSKSEELCLKQENNNIEFWCKNTAVLIRFWV